MRRAICLASLIAACGADGERRGFIVTPGMDDSVPFDTYEPSKLDPAKPTLLLPPEGTVPMDHEPFAYGRSTEEAERAGRELSNPYTSSADLARGKQVYEVFCAVCHGAGGQGDGPIIGRFPNPPSLLANRAKTLPDGHLFHIITHGQGIMAPYAVQVRPADRWKAILHIRTLQGIEPAVRTATTSTSTGSQP